MASPARCSAAKSTVAAAVAGEHAAGAVAAVRRRGQADDRERARRPRRSRGPAGPSSPRRGTRPAWSRATSSRQATSRGQARHTDTGVERGPAWTPGGQPRRSAGVAGHRRGRAPPGRPATRSRRHRQVSPVHLRARRTARPGDCGRAALPRAGRYAPPADGDPNSFVEHVRSAALSLGTYSIPAGGVDDQVPHAQAVYVVPPAGRLHRRRATVPVGPGTVLVVPAGEEHRFHDVTADLAVLVVFAPPYSGRAGLGRRLLIRGGRRTASRRRPASLGGMLLSQFGDGRSNAAGRRLGVVRATPAGVRCLVVPHGTGPTPRPPGLYADDVWTLRAARSVLDGQRPTLLGGGEDGGHYPGRRTGQILHRRDPERRR